MDLKYLGRETGWPAALWRDVLPPLESTVFLNFLPRWVNRECDTAAVVSASEKRCVMLREVFHQARKLRDRSSESSPWTREFSGWRPLQRAQGGGPLSLLENLRQASDVSADSLYSKLSLLMCTVSVSRETQPETGEPRCLTTACREDRV